MIVILDSGHNEYVEGKESPDKTLREWDFNNKMQNLIKNRLEEHNIKVYLTNPIPSKKNEIGLNKRCDIANNICKQNKGKNILFISLHANAHQGYFTEARGVETFIASNHSKKSKDFANLLNTSIYNNIKKIDNNFKNRGVKVNNYYVIKNTICPCVLVEYGFYTNKQDLQILKNNKKELTEATIIAICSYFNINYKAPDCDNITEANKEIFYRVVVGSFTEKSNADKLLEELKRKNYNPFIEVFNKK